MKGEALRKKRFYQFIRYYTLPVRNRSLLHTADRRDCLRVPPEEYRWNLDRFISEIRSAGAVPILITAPRASTLDARLVERGNISSVADGLRLHDEYAQYTREAAARNNAPLLDLHQLMRDPPLNRLFSGDGIHFTQDGLAFVAQALEAKLRELARSGGD